jgi:hypothetical protein
MATRWGFAGWFSMKAVLPITDADSAYASVLALLRRHLLGHRFRLITIISCYMVNRQGVEGGGPPPARWWRSVLILLPTFPANLP